MIRSFVAALVVVAGGCGSVRRGEPAPRPAPPSVPDVTTATPAFRIAAGEDASCLLRPGDDVLCWGEGQVGAFALGEESGAIELAAAGTQLCVRHDNGDVSCASPFHERQSPFAHDAVTIGVGPAHACAAHAQGRVTCWGDGTFGRLGADADDGFGEVQELPEIVELALGTAHSCALTRDGRVHCWGLGSDPEARCEAGVGDAIRCEGGGEGSGQTPRVVEGLSDVRSIAAVGHRTCALSGDGLVRCFRVMRHDTSGRWPLRRIAEVRGAETLVLGPSLGCVVADGRVLCWGSDDRGQRGDGDGVMGEREVSAVAGLTDVVDVDVGEEHACAVLESGEARCWGANDVHQLGNGAAGFDGTPAGLAIIGVADLLGDASLLCALLDDGTVQCLGRNDRGQLGDGTLVSHWDFSPVVGLSRIAQLDVAVDHACAVDRRGDLRCWGDNRRLFLGPSHRPDPPSLSAPVRATWLRGISEVATTLAGTCTRSRSGRVSCFGRLAGPRREPSVGPVSDVGRATDIDGGRGHFCASLRGGRVRCWGSGPYGQLGVDPASSDASRLVPGIGDARSVAVGCTFSCALRAGGEVSCWGDLPDWPAGAEPFSIAGVSDAAELEAGCHHACVRTGAGEILCWGGNERGQLGAGRVSHAEPPVRLPYAGDLFVLDRATCVDRGGGALTCFGEVPGVPERADQPAPVSVSILPPR